MNKQTKVVILLAAIILSALLGTACSNEQAGIASNESAVKTQPAKPPSDKGDQVVTGGDLTFMNDAAQGGMAEVEMGRMAAVQAVSSEVKQFAERMIKDHSQAGEELKQLAGAKKVVLPMEMTPKQKEMMEKFSKLKGSDFDREYIKAMVADHEKDVAAFEATAKNGTDADVKAFAAKILPTLKDHMQMIRSISEKMGAKTNP
jgi:putative membrane protein